MIGETEYIAAPSRESPFFANTFDRGGFAGPDDREWDVESVIPETWTITRRNPWTYVGPPRERMLVCGWKIHLSASMDNADEILKTAIEICCSHGVSFKFLGSYRQFLQANSEQAPRSASGKFITIYPDSNRQVDDLVDELHPRILTPIGQANVDIAVSRHEHRKKTIMQHESNLANFHHEFPIVASNVCWEVSARRGETVRVLDGVDFVAGWGAITGIVGPSGSGKSTLLYCLAGLEQVTSGAVDVLGHRVSEMGMAASARFRRSHLGFVFQSYNLVPSMTVEDNLKLPFTLRGTRFPRDTATGILDRLGISKLVKTNVTLLSGGEQQRVALARTLVADPEVIFADEPTGALDVDSGRRVVNELVGFAARPDHAVVMVTHSPEVAARCDRVVRLKDGRIADAGERSSLKAGV